MAYATVSGHAPRNHFASFGHFFGEVQHFFELFAAAIHVSAALRAHAKPAARDLKTLGIENYPFPSFL